jgi:hypothetical protein
MPWLVRRLARLQLQLRLCLLLSDEDPEFNDL